ncbi:MerR family transcriptional regulator [Nocardiopsis sp. NPDC049922]|uniref:MerR family transcriptional regulator n=1 Tax=Nocardiopsis sp. NPDC049922 TaxID=3155157 RepID=UPI0033C9EEAC
MRISELCDRASVPVATVEYYQREHLIDLPSEKHGYRPEDVRRVRLVRALIEVGGLGPAEVRTLLDDMSGSGRTPHKTFSLVLRALNGDTGGEPASEPAAEPVDDRASTLARRLADRHGWRMEPRAEHWESLLKVLRMVLWLDDANAEFVVEAYAAAVEQVTAAELQVMGWYADEDALVERVVLWTVLGDRLLASLRQISRKNGSRQVFDQDLSPADRGSAR